MINVILYKNYPETTSDEISLSITLCNWKSLKIQFNKFNIQQEIQRIIIILLITNTGL